VNMPPALESSDSGGQDKMRRRSGTQQMIDEQDEQVMAADTKMSELLDPDRHFKVEPDWPEHRQTSAKMLQSKLVLIGIPILIGASSVLCVWEVNATAEGGSSPVWLDVVKLLIELVFVVEMGARLNVHRMAFFRAAGNIFDLAIVISDLFLSVIEICFNFEKGLSAGFLRIFRIVRTLRMSRVLVGFHELHLIVHGFVGAMRAIFWGAVLIGIALVLWSMIAVEVLNPLAQELADDGAFEGCDRCGRAFSTIYQSSLTFFQTIVAGDSWGQLALPIIEKQPLASCIFIGVLISVQLGLMNLILAVIVDRATDARLENNYFTHLEKESQYESYKKQMVTICAQLDRDGGGFLTKDELIGGACHSVEFANLLKLMDLSMDELGALFEILDTDRSGSISYSEFVEQLHRMKNGDSHTLLMLIKHDVMKVHDDLKLQLKTIEENFDRMFQQASAPRAEVNFSPPEALLSCKPETQSQVTPNTAFSETGNLGSLPNGAGMVSANASESVSILSARLEGILVKIQGDMENLQKQVLSNPASTFQPSVFTKAGGQESLRRDGSMAVQLAAVPAERFPAAHGRDGGGPAFLACCERPETSRNRAALISPATLN